MTQYYFFTDALRLVMSRAIYSGGTMNSINMKLGVDATTNLATTAESLPESVRQNVLPLPAPHASTTKFNQDVASLVGVKLTLEAFNQLCGKMAGYPFVKIVADRKEETIHFINHSRYPFHIDYAAEKILGM